MDEYYGHNDYRDYLAHHGVKGMRWREHKYTGIVNGSYMYDAVSGGNSRTRSIAARAGRIANPSRAYIEQVNRLQESLITPNDRNNARANRKDSSDEEPGKISKSTDRMLEKTANDVIRGKYSVGDDRRRQLEKKGLSYAVVQNKVNEMLGSSKRHAVSAKDLKKVNSYYNKIKNQKVPEIANVKAVFDGDSKKKKNRKTNKIKNGKFMTL